MIPNITGDQIAEAMQKFKNHKVVKYTYDKSSDTTYIRFRNPESSRYSVTFAFIDNCVFMTGDIGQIVMTLTTSPTIYNLNDCIDEISYYINKITLPDKHSLAIYDEPTARRELTRRLSDPSFTGAAPSQKVIKDLVDDLIDIRRTRGNWELTDEETTQIEPYCSEPEDWLPGVGLIMPQCLACAFVALQLACSQAVEMEKQNNIDY